jgi:RHS repeat-associated protein
MSSSIRISFNKVTFLKNILVLACLSVFTVASSQSNNTAFSATESGGQSHSSCKSIQLNPGYQYTPSTGATNMQAFINPYATCEAVYGSSMPVSGNNPPGPLNQGMEVGTTAGAYTLTESGGAFYSIPLAIPPGTNGMSPALSINYNSQGGLSLMGTKWVMSGLSSISRIAASTFYDQTVGAISLNNNDRFVLDGAHLTLKSSSYGAAGATYATDIDNYSLITSIGQTGSGPAYFQVQTKNGYMMEYGNSSDSYIEASGNATALTWLLNKVTDNNGNYMRIYYFEDNINGEFRPDHIDYSANDAQGLSPYNQVKFVYARRNDKQVAYISGRPVSQSVVLVGIEMWAEGSKVHEYNFNYSFDAILGSRLSEVIEKGSDGKSYNSTKIGWDQSTVSGIPAPSSGEKAIGPVPNSALAIIPYTGDFNGDGLTDYFAIHTKTGTDPGTTGDLYINNGNGFNAPVSTRLPSGYAATIQGAGDESQKEAAVDGDGDGKDDLIMYCIDLQNIDNYVMFRSMGNSGFDVRSASFSTGRASTNGHKEIIGDFDGDGTTDVFVYYYDLDVWYFHSFSRNVTYSANVDWGDASLFFATVNFDGGGKDHIMFTYNNKQSGQDYNYILTLNSNGTLGVLSNGTFPNSCEGAPERFHIGDFNGDGRTDLLVYDVCSPHWSICYGTGANTKYSESPSPVPGWVNPSNSWTYELYVSDFNGDGKSDIAFIDHSKTPNQILTIYYSQGNNNFISTNMAVNNDWVPTKSSIGDFNGDGHADILHSGYASGGNIQYGVYFQCTGIAGNVPVYSDYNRVTQITNGLNAQIDLDYNTLSELGYKRSIGNWENIYTKGPDGTYPIQATQKPFPVVSIAKTDDGIGGKITSQYAYSGARVHLQGKGFLGFNGKTIINDDLSTKTEYTYSLDISNGSLMSLPIETKTSLFGSGGVTQTVIEDKTLQYTFNKTTFGTFSRYQIYANQTVDNDLLHGNTTTVTSHQDTYGNTDACTTSNAAVSTNQTSAFEQKGAWIPGRLTVATTTTTQSGQPAYTRTISYANDNNGRPTTVTSDVGTTTTIGFDGFGNTLYSFVSGTGIPNVINTYTYDSYGRFSVQHSNYLGVVEKTTRDKANGNILTSTNINLLTTSYIYDGFGRLLQTTSPSNQQIFTSRFWVSGSGPANSTFYVKTVASGNPTCTEYYDLQGRSVRKQTVGFDGTLINKDIVYNHLGQVLKTSEPYFDGNPTLYSVFTYDAFSRLLTANNVSGANAAYSYSGNTTTVNTSTANGTKLKKSVLDAVGHLISAVDNGGTINYTYHSCGKPLTITLPGTAKAEVMTYDNFGRLTSLNDPDAGLTKYTYDIAGEVLSEQDAKGNTTTFTYDALGRTLTKIISEGTITYQYDTKSHAIGALGSVTGINGNNQDFTYDNFGNLQTTSEIIDGNNYITSYTYDAMNRPVTTTYPSGFAISNVYNVNGYLQAVNKTSDNSTIWQCTAKTVRNQVLTSLLGNGGAITKIYDNFGFLKEMLAKEKSGTSSPVNAVDYQYSFDATTGNLLSRKDNIRALTESFTYDPLDRFASANLNGVSSLTVNYNTAASINSKSDAGGSYSYAGPPAHAVTSITNPSAAISAQTENITYTSFQKTLSITEGTNLRLNFTYGSDFERKKTVLNNSGSITTTLFSGKYEKITDPSNTVYEVHYINSSDGLTAINVRSNGIDKMYYVHPDHLGSIANIYDSQGTLVFAQSFDAWGRTRSATDWSSPLSSTPPVWFIRGYTGHEQLTPFKLINMNGRMYDPLLGRMLSPDKYVEACNSTQGYNRYSYCYNNPLKYKDPSGNYALVDDLICGLVGGAINLGVNFGNIHSFGQGVAFFGVGFVSGALTEYITPVGSAALAGAGNAIILGTEGNGPVDPGAVFNAAVFSGMIAFVTMGVGNKISPFVGQALSGISSPVLRGAISYGAVGLVSGGVGGGMGAVMSGGNFWQGVGQGAIWGVGIGVATGAYQGYKSSASQSPNPDPDPDPNPSPQTDPGTDPGKGKANGIDWDNAQNTTLNPNKNKVNADLHIKDEQQIMDAYNEFARLYGALDAQINEMPTKNIGFDGILSNGVKYQVTLSFGNDSNINGWTLKINTWSPIVLPGAAPIPEGQSLYMRLKID